MKRWRLRKPGVKVHDRAALVDTTEKLIEKATKKYLDACEGCDVEQANNYHWWLKYYHSVRSMLLREPTGTMERQVLTYRLSAMFLNDVRTLLIDGNGNENECYCSGILDKEANTATPVQVLPIKLARQSAVCASGDASSIYHTLSELDRWAHPILMFCHSHPGHGPGSIHPSRTDLSTQKDLEVSYQIVGAIFSQDGHVRFFSAGKPFQVEIFGKGVTEFGDNVYRIQD